MTRSIHATEGKPTSAGWPIPRHAGAGESAESAASGADDPASPFQSLLENVQAERPRLEVKAREKKELERRTDHRRPEVAPLDPSSVAAAQGAIPRRPLVVSTANPGATTAAPPSAVSGANLRPAGLVQPGMTGDPSAPGGATPRDGSVGPAAPDVRMTLLGAGGAAVESATAEPGILEAGPGGGDQRVPGPAENAAGDNRALAPTPNVAEGASAIGRASPVPRPGMAPLLPGDNPPTHPQPASALPRTGPPPRPPLPTTAPNRAQAGPVPNQRAETNAASNLSARGSDAAPILATLSGPTPEASGSADPRSGSSRGDLGAKSTPGADPTIAPPAVPFADASSGLVGASPELASANVPSQVLSFIAGHAFPRGDTTLVMRLTPPELGSIVLQIQSFDGQRLRLRFEVEHAAAGDALLRGKEQIESVLRGRGLVPDTFAVDLSKTPADPSTATGSFAWANGGSGPGAFSDDSGSDDREQKERSTRTAPVPRGAGISIGPSDAALIPGGSLVDYRL